MLDLELLKLALVEAGPTWSKTCEVTRSSNASQIEVRFHDYGLDRYAVVIVDLDKREPKTTQEITWDLLAACREIPNEWVDPTLLTCKTDAIAGLEIGQGYRVKSINRDTGEVELVAE